MNLENKRILFIGPKFFDYEKKIIFSLEKRGALVDFFPEKVNGPFYGFCLNYFKYIALFLEKKHLNNIIVKMKSSYDIVFLIRGEIITEAFMENIKKRFPTAKYVMYQWDSQRNNSNFLKLIKYFDKVTTFDKIDAINLGLDYLPLFYIDDYVNINLDKERVYDLVFFGSYHGDRLNVLKGIIKEANRIKIAMHSFLYIPKVKLLRLLVFRKISFSDIQYLSTKKITSAEILHFYKKTKAVLDIESSGQNGLTIRTFEVLSAGLKLITTNTNIKDEDFFNSNRIDVIDRKQILLNLDFFSINIKQFNMQKYSLENWLDYIFDVEIK